MRWEARVIDGHVLRVANLDSLTDPPPDPDVAALDDAIAETQDGLLRALFDPDDEP